MSRHNKKNGECVYCGAKGPITDDHVPPRSFYPPMPPANLITVPSCRKCNVEFSKEDDYVRFVLAVNEKARGNPDRDQIIPAVKRFAERKESRELLIDLYASLDSAYRRTPAGIHVRSQYFTADGTRMDAFARRVVKALFYREKGHRLPAGYIVNPIHHTKLDALARQSQDSREFLSFIITELIEHSEHQAWGEVFGYSWVQSPNDPEQAWWLLDFYGSAEYLCSTWKESENATSLLII